MKKFYFSVLAIASFASAAMAQQFTLGALEATDDLERVDYFYTDFFKVNEMRRSYKMEPYLNTITLVQYDDQKREIRNELYQDMNQVGSEDYHDYAFNAYIEFFYGENGLVAERKNYNNWSMTEEPDFQLGAVITYEYDADNHLAFVNSYWDEAKTDLFQKNEYKYDTNGNLSSVVYIMKDFMTGEMIENYKEEYEYDADNRLIGKRTSTLDYDTQALVDNGSIEFTYNDKGSLAADIYKDPNGTILEKREYGYTDDAVSASEVAFPYMFEESSSNELYSLFTFAPEYFDYYTINQQTNKLENVATYRYDYDSTTGIRTVSNASGSELTLLAVANGKLRLGGVADGELVRVFRLDGRQAGNAIVSSGSIDLSGLPHGVYIISSPKGAMKVNF